MMTSFKTLKTALLCTALACTVACGGPVVEDSSDDDLSSQTAPGPFEPFAHFSAVQKLAARYAKNPVAVSLHGVINGDALQRNSGAYTWTWTLSGGDGIFVDVLSGPKGNKVLAHEKRYFFAGQGTFDPKNVPVDGNDVVQLVLKAGLSQPSELMLGAGLAQQMTATWTAICGGKRAQVNAETGDISK